MQYGLRIIFETQLSHKTKRGQMTEVRGQITDVKGQGGRRQAFLNIDFGMRKVEYDIKCRVQGLRLKNDFILFCLEP